MKTNDRTATAGGSAAEEKSCREDTGQLSREKESTTNMPETE